MQVKNISPDRLVWNNLVNKETGSTLELGPGESADAWMWVLPKDEKGVPTQKHAELVDLPADFKSPQLEVVVPAAPAVVPTPQPAAPQSPPPAPAPAPTGPSTAPVTEE